MLNRKRMNDSVRATEDPFEDFDLICDFPWALGTFAELRRFVRVVHQFMPHATDQQTVRLRTRIKAETDPVSNQRVREWIRSSRARSLHRYATLGLGRRPRVGVCCLRIRCSPNPQSLAGHCWSSPTICSEKRGGLPHFGGGICPGAHPCPTVRVRLPTIKAFGTQEPSQLLCASRKPAIDTAAQARIRNRTEDSRWPQSRSR